MYFAEFTQYIDPRHNRKIIICFPNITLAYADFVRNEIGTIEGTCLILSDGKHIFITQSYDDYIEALARAQIEFYKAMQSR